MSPAQQRRGKLAVVQTPAPGYKVAEVADVEQAAAGMTVSVLECRDFGHTWTTASIIRIKGAYQRWLWCKRCKTNRRQTLSMDGEILESHYQYMEGYELKGLGRMLGDGRMALRRESLERAASKGQIQDGIEKDAVVTKKPKAQHSSAMGDAAPARARKRA